MRLANPSVVIPSERNERVPTPWWRFLVAVAASFCFHAVLLAIVAWTIPSPSVILPEGGLFEETSPIIIESTNDTPAPAILNLENIGLDVNTEPFRSERHAEIDIPLSVDPSRDVGLRSGTGEGAPSPSMPREFESSAFGPGGLSRTPGEGVLGATMGGGAVMNDFAWRKNAGMGSGASREQMLGKLGISPAAQKETEAIVVRGLHWLVRQQSPDGRWMLDGAFPDKGQSNDIAGTAFGLLPLLAAGKTHQPTKKDAAERVFEKALEKGLAFLVRRQDRRTGELGGGMYGHALATIALTEAFGLSQDPVLRGPAQKAVHYIVAAQHEAGGWRYSPREAGDMSVTGWQVMALKSAVMAGLDVPDIAFRRATRFLDSCRDSELEGYGYVDRKAVPTTSAIGLLCRQYVQQWGPRNPAMIQGIDKNLRPTPPGAKKDTYYYYYATQVMYHFGGEAWRNWGDKIRQTLIKSSHADAKSNLYGSWSSEGDVWGKNGGRLMVTSMNLLTLEVHYRFLPLYYRSAVVAKEN